MAVLAIVGGGLQVLGILLTVVQLYGVRKRYLAQFGPDGHLTAGQLPHVGEPLRDLASGGWRYGIVSVSLIVVGIVCTTVGSVVQ